MVIIKKALPTAAPAHSGDGSHQNYHYESPSYPTSYYRTADSYYITPTSQDEFPAPYFDSTIPYYITEASSRGSVVAYYIYPASDEEVPISYMSGTANYYQDAKHTANRVQSHVISTSQGGLCDPSQNRFPAEPHWANRKHDDGHYQRPRKPLMESVSDFMKTILQREGEQEDVIRVKKNFTYLYAKFEGIESIVDYSIQGGAMNRGLLFAGLPRRRRWGTVCGKINKIH